MKLRVLRELPCSSVGDILECNHNLHIFEFCGSSISVPNMIALGWLEEIQEDKSLEERLDCRIYCLTKLEAKEIAEFAKSHILERVEKLNDGTGILDLGDTLDAIKTA